MCIKSAFYVLTLNEIYYEWTMNELFQKHENRNELIYNLIWTT